MDGEELGFGENVGVGGGGTEVGQRAADCRDIVPNGQVRDVNFEEKFLVKQILELLYRPSSLRDRPVALDEAAQCANVGEWHSSARECPPDHVQGPV